MTIKKTEAHGAFGKEECAHLRRVAAAASRIESPLALVVGLTAFVPCDAQALCVAPIELMDLQAGTIRVLDDAGHWAPVAAGPLGTDRARKLAGDRRRGPLAVDEHGEVLRMDDDAQAYASEMLGEVDAGLLDMPWSLLSLRAAHVRLLRVIGTPWDVVRAQAGVSIDTPHRWRLPRLQRQAACEIADLLMYSDEPSPCPRPEGFTFEILDRGDLS